MSVTFSFDYWVPRENLLRFFTCIFATASGGEMYSSRKPSSYSRFSASISGHFMFPFEADTVLHKWAKEYDSAQYYLGEANRRGLTPEASARIWKFPNASMYDVGSFEISCNLHPFEYDWMGGESLLAQIHMRCSISDIRDLMYDSPPVQRFFVRLAREGGATSCVFDAENDYVRVLFLDGQEHDYRHSIKEEPNCFREDHPRYLRQDLAKDISPEEKAILSKLHFCGVTIEQEVVSSEEQDELVRLSRDKDSGVRARACYALHLTESPLAEQVVSERSIDVDWRTRAVAEAVLIEMEEDRQSDA